MVQGTPLSINGRQGTLLPRHEIDLLGRVSELKVSIVGSCRYLDRP